MMKVDVFEFVANYEATATGAPPEPMYRYEFRPAHALAAVEALRPHLFLCRVFCDILDAIRDDTNYQSKYAFDRNVFQKFIAVMFVRYAAADPRFYGA